MGLRQMFGIETRFVVCSDDDFVQVDGNTGTVCLVRQGRKDDFKAVLRNLLAEGAESPNPIGSLPLVVLHYVGYGYDRTGAPEWIAKGLEELLEERLKFSLVTIFHELYASSMPWRRAFWYSHKQKRMARLLRTISSHAMCTTERSENILRCWTPEADLIRLSIPSGVGEPLNSEVPDWPRRRNALIVFGRGHSRKLAYGYHRLLQALCARLSIKEIIDVGPSLAKLPRFKDVSLSQVGVLPSERISELLSECRYGFLYYPSDYLAKSSIFAAYCAHRVATFVPSARPVSSDGLENGRHFVVARDAIDGPVMLETVADEAHEWYQSHSIRQHTSWLAELCSRYFREAGMRVN
jgi:hypothetical protein